ncbi:MAG TPA: YopX family protein, partial [Candidatus Dojkabacteria bacterium]|nr:YopX family protein [Candidatus Dojkabacteria bacterium]
VGQYTGLKDKNGKEIYEGDVINYLDNSHDYGEFGFGIRKGVCEFSNHTGSFFFRGDDGDTRDYMNLVNMQEKWSKESYQTVSSPFRDGKLVKSYTEIEIIGNIYENPNLLSQDK